MTNLAIREFNNQTIRFREDGYVCLTDMAKASGKLFGNWSRLDSTKSYLEALSGIIGIPLSQLVIKIQGGTPELQGTWGHPEVAKEFERWCNLKEIKKSTKVFEESYRDNLALVTGGVVELIF